MKPLAGKMILVTRPRKQASSLATELENLGATVCSMPAIEILPIESTAKLDAALRDLSKFDWVVLTSVNGVKAVAGRMRELGISVAELGRKRLAAIGPATADALEELVRRPDLVPDEYVSEAIVGAIAPLISDSRPRFLLARADIARKDLADLLRGMGCEVDEIAAYRIVRAGAAPVLPNRAPDYITLTSSSAARNTLEILREAGRQEWMGEARLACIGPITAGTVRELGYTVAVEAEEYTVSGLVRALIGDAAADSNAATESVNA